MIGISLKGGERPKHWPGAIWAKKFQPTLPVRGATYDDLARAFAELISTHAPRAGSDAGCGIPWSAFSYFNPRSPCGERHPETGHVHWTIEFQPTLPVRGATRGAG